MNSGTRVRRHPSSQMKSSHARLKNTHAKRVVMAQSVDESEARYRQLAETTIDVIIVHDLNGNITYINPAGVRLTGYSQSEIMSINISQLLPEDELSAMREHAQKRIEGDTSVYTYQTKLISRDGRLFQVEAQSTLMMEQSKISGVLVVARDISDRYNTQKILWESENRFSRVFHASTISIAISQLKTGQMIDANDSFLHLIGYSREEVIGHTGAELNLWPSSSDRPDTISQLLVEGTLPATPSRIRSKSGELRDTLSSLELIELGGQQCILAIVQDNTERIRVEKAEYEQRVMAEALCDTAALLNSTLQLDEVLERVLETLARVVPHETASIMLIDQGKAGIIRHRGFEKYGVSDKTLKDVYFSVDSSPFLTHIVSTRQPIILDDVTTSLGWQVVKGNEWIRSYIGAPILFEGELLGIINIDSDLIGAFTERHATGLAAFAHQASIAIRNARHATELEQRVTERMAELSLERSRLEAVLDFTGEGLFYTEEQIIRYANPTFCRMMGYSQTELEGQTTALLIGQAPDAEFFKRWERAKPALLEGRVVRWEREFKRKDGTTFHVAQTLSWVGEATEPILLVSLVRDISEEKQLEAQKMRFIANAAHELRNPIMGLGTRLYLLKRQPERLNEHLLMIERVTHRLTRLVDDLLDVARFENGVIQLRPHEITLQGIVQDVIELQQEIALQKSIRLTLDLMPEPLLVMVDSDRILQVLTNLINNAIHYTFEDGLIHIKVFRVKKEGQDYAAVSIADNGVGIAREDLAHIFKPFYRANKVVQGTGLGLSISHEIMLLHKGEITVESEVGKGSLFTIWLPLLPAES